MKYILDVGRYIRILIKSSNTKNMWANPHVSPSRFYSSFIGNQQRPCPPFFVHLQSLSVIILSFKLQYPRKNSQDRSPCISLKNSLRDLIKDQRTVCLAIIFFIHCTPRIRFTPNLLSAYRVQKSANYSQIKGKNGKYGICPWIYKLCKLGCKCGIYQIFAFDLLLVCTFLRFIFICREEIHGCVNLFFSFSDSHELSCCLFCY